MKIKFCWRKFYEIKEPFAFLIKLSLENLDLLIFSKGSEGQDKLPSSIKFLGKISFDSLKFSNKQVFIQTLLLIKILIKLFSCLEKVFRQSNKTKQI